MRSNANRAGGAIRHGARLLIETALPPVCAGCGVSGTWLCPRCADSERLIDRTTMCLRCGRPRETVGDFCQRCAIWSGSIDAARSAYQFDGAIRTMIHLLKYEGERARADWCGDVVARTVEDAHWPIDLIVPVPLHRSKERSRGYNQSWLISRRVAQQLRLDVNDVLVRTRQTQSQVDLDAEKRRENVRGAFVARRQLGGVRVLLVDDVITTGSTLVECASACRQAGAMVVFAVSVATA